MRCFVKMCLRILAGSLLLAASAFPAAISFSGAYAPINWNLTTNGGDGSVFTGNAPNSILLQGSDTGADMQIVTLYSITVPVNIVLDFFWRYDSFDVDGPGFDPAGYSINGVFTQLSSNAGLSNQTGSVTGLSLTAGQVFAFYVDSGDDLFGRAQIEIFGSDPNQASLPEPGTWALMGAGTILLGVWRRRTGATSAR